MNEWFGRVRGSRGGLLVVLLGVGCVCQTDASIAAGGPKAVGKASTEKAPPAKAPEGKALEAKAPDAKVESGGASGPVPIAKPLPGDAEDPLGQRFADPSWFRKDLLEGATAKDVSRTERNEQGLFSSQILFELAAGTTAEQCADQIEAKVKPDVANLTRSADEKMPGRLRLSGDTPRYKVTIICGVAAGATRAYVGYEWTS